MLKLALILISALSLASSSAFAASYQRTDGTIVDPIQRRSGGDHPYSGINLEPSADLSNADLSGANLIAADLLAANLSGANLSNAELGGSNLVGAILAGANLAGAALSGSVAPLADLTGALLWGASLEGVTFTTALLSGADFSGANLTNAIDLAATTIGIPYYNANTIFTGAWADPQLTIPFDPVAAGWTLVPEPGSALLIGLGLIGLAARGSR